MQTTLRRFTLLSVLALPALAMTADLKVTCVNQLAIARTSQTIELSAAQLAPLAAKSLDTIHVKDAAGKEVLCQAVDTDFDAMHEADIVIFQADFAPGETNTFTVTTGKKQIFSKEQFKAFGRFVRERFDDFAWENDRIAHRTYGKALETWAGEPLTSSSIDIWSKRTPRMVINDWYMADHYHTDTGEGADFYSAGNTRGCGGIGLWAADKLWVPRNFVASRVLANGPIRVLFELDYEAFDVNGVKVTETKRVSLDAGSQLDHFVSTYHPEKPVALTCGIGLKKVAGEQKEYDASNGCLAVWENVEKNSGMQGVALVMDPASIKQETEDKQNNLLLVTCAPDHPVSYWAGFAWDRAGLITDAAAWNKYVHAFARGLASPIEVKVSAP